jgi:hypothetical protein
MWGRDCLLVTKILRGIVVGKIWRVISPVKTKHNLSPQKKASVSLYHKMVHACPTHRAIKKKNPDFSLDSPPYVLTFHLTARTSLTRSLVITLEARRRCTSSVLLRPEQNHAHITTEARTNRGNENTVARRPWRMLKR